MKHKKPTIHRESILVCIRIIGDRQSGYLENAQEEVDTHLKEPHSDPDREKDLPAYCSKRSFRELDQHRRQSLAAYKVYRTANN